MQNSELIKIFKENNKLVEQKYKGTEFRRVSYIPFKMAVKLVENGKWEEKKFILVVNLPKVK